MPPLVHDRTQTPNLLHGRVAPDRWLIRVLAVTERRGRPTIWTTSRDGLCRALGDAELIERSDVMVGR
jgi:hypothetical protein